MVNTNLLTTGEGIQQLISLFKVEYGSSTNTDSWLFTVETHLALRYLNHLSKLRPLPSRKLRKCHLRKFYAQRKRERRRYL